VKKTELINNETPVKMTADLTYKKSNKKTPNKYGPAKMKQKNSSSKKISSHSAHKCISDKKLTTTGKKKFRKIKICRQN
jgi:hypothetical protein